MLTKIKKLSLIACAVALVLCGFVFADQDYSSSSDPLVTLSYVNTTLKQQLKADILAELSTTVQQPTAVDVDVAYEVVAVNKGETLMCKNACELVLRSGTAVAVVTDPVNIENKIGLSDLTASREVINGGALSANHYLIVPRGDGRGVYVTSDIAYFMVRGEYEIIK